MFAEAVILIDDRLVKLNDITLEEWLDLKFGYHKKVDKEIMERVLASKFNNHMPMDWYTKNALWLYWKRGDDEEVLTCNELSDLEEENLREDTEITKIFRIETIYSTLIHLYANNSRSLIIFSKLMLTGNLPGMIRVGNMTYFQNYKWYKGLEDGDLKDEALKKKLSWMDHGNIRIEKERIFFSWLKEIFSNQERLDNHELIEDDDDDDIEDLDDYLIPQDASYYIDEEEERFKERKSKLLGIPYEKPPTFKSKSLREVLNMNERSGGERIPKKDKIGSKPDKNGKRGKAGKSQKQLQSSSKLARDQTSNPTSSTNPTPKGRIPKSSKQKVENSHFEENLTPVATMTDNRTMAEMLRAPTEGCAEAIVVPPILAEQFKLKHSLINMMTSEQFFGLEKDNPHDHIRWFNKITSTIKYKDVPDSVIKLILFPFSLAGAAHRWLEKEPTRSITTWDDLVLKFINEFFPPSRTMNIRNEISNFQQKFDESFHEAWERYKDLLRVCPHHGFTELHQLDTFYNALNLADQDSLNAAAVGNLLEKSPQDALTIIENKSKVYNSRSKPIASPVNACNNHSSFEIAKLTHAVNQQTIAVTTAMTAMLKQLQANPPLAQVATLSQKIGITSKVTFQQPQATTIRNFHLNELDKLKRMNDVSLKAMQNQIEMVKNELMSEMKTSIQTSLSNQTNEIKNMMASLLQINIASTLGSRSLPGNTVANPKGELKAITTRSGLVTNGPTVPTPPKFVNPEEDECVEETYTDPDLAKYTIKVSPPPVQKPKPPVQKPKPPIQRHFVLHTRDSPPSHIPYPSRMLKQKQQEKDDIQIQKFWNMFKQLHLNITLAEALVLMPKYQKMLQALLSNKEKLQELANTPLNENCSTVILKKLPKKLRDPGKFLIPYGFSELKCKALADLGASINLMPLSVWKKLGLPDLIPTRMTLELANHAICTPNGIARDVFVPVGKFTFPADFVVVDYESDPRVPLILGRPFLRTARALIDVYSEEMILHAGDKRLTLNMKHDTASYSNHPHRESVNLINIFNLSSEDCLEDLVSNKQSGNPTFSLHKEIASSKVIHKIHDSKGCNFLSEELPYIDSFNDIHPYFDDDLLSGSTTYSTHSLLKEFTDELALITYPMDYDDNPTCDIESDLREIEFLLYQGEDSVLKDLIDQPDLANRDDLFVDPTPEMFTNEQPPDYSFPLRFDVYPDDFLEIESDAVNFDDDLFDSKGEKIKEAELLIDQLDLPCDILSEYDSFNSQDFSRDDDLPSPDNEDKVFNPGILIHEKLVTIITRVAQEKKLVVSFTSLLFEDFDPSFYELLVFKEVPNSMRLLLFSSENEEKVFKPRIYTSKKVHLCFLSELSHPVYHIFKVNLIFISLMRIFHVQSGKNTPPLDVLLFHFIPLIHSSMGEFGPVIRP
nr:reverse transcriptase domain-containing protein [Tanacetum cinerariifolium]